MLPNFSNLRTWGFALLKRWVWFAALGLIACSGGSATGGGDVGGTGNWAAGPMSIPAPATINKGMIYCDNVLGPKVDCYGKPGAVDPNAKVTIKVQPPGYSSPKSWESIFLGTAHAIPGFTASGFADGGGAFGPISVVATAGEVLEIQACVGGRCSAKLLLVVPIEGGSVSGSTGTIKLMTVDPDGNAWMSRNFRMQDSSRPRWNWKSLFFSEAHAAEAEPIAATSVSFSAPALDFANCEGQEVDRATLDAQIRAISQQAVIRRNVAGRGEITDAITLPNLQQADIRVIRPFQVGVEKYLAVGAGQRLFLLKVTNPEQVQWFREIRYPYPIQEIWNFSAALYVFLGGEGIPSGANRLYKLATEWQMDWASSCFSSQDTAAFTGLESIVAADSLELAFAVVGRFNDTGGKEYRVLVGKAEPHEFIFQKGPKVIFQNEQPMEVKFLKADAAGFTLALLDSAGKRMAFLHRDWGSLDQMTNSLDRGLLLTDLVQASGPWEVGATSQLYSSVDRNELAFFNVLDQRVELALLPFNWGAGGEVIASSQVQVHLLGDVLPNVLARDDTEGRQGWVIVRANGTLERFVPPREQNAPVLEIPPMDGLQEVILIPGGFAPPR